jgi:cysteine desulfurase
MLSVNVNNSIYLDYAAATPLDPRVRLSMEPYMQEDFYNPSSPYLAARHVRRDVDAARARVAYWLGARGGEVIFTAGATESINIAIHGVTQQFPGANAIALATEHDAVLQSVARYPHQLAPVLPNGSVDMDALAQLIDDQTVLISVAYANNEVGTIQPLTQIAELVRHVREGRQMSGNKLPLYFHTDASQAAGCLDLHASRLGVDLMTLNGGKIYGPKQTGVLYVKAGTKITSPLTGGGQEGGVRSGTENVPGIIGFATALEIAQDEKKEAISKYTSMRDELQCRILQALPDTIVNGNPRRRLPGSLHLSWPGLDGERLVMLLDERGVMAATGSACAANKQTASHVLVACGMADDAVRGSLRLTVGALTTPGDIERAAGIIIECVCKIGR